MSAQDQLSALLGHMHVWFHLQCFRQSVPTFIGGHFDCKIEFAYLRSHSGYQIHCNHHLHYCIFWVTVQCVYLGCVDVITACQILQFGKRLYYYVLSNLPYLTVQETEQISNNRGMVRIEELHYFIYKLLVTN